MNESGNKFQIILIAAFIIFAIIGVVLFSANRVSNSGASRSVTVWGSMEEKVFMGAFASAGLADQYLLEYRYIDASNLDRELTEALAEDRGPDLVVYPHEYTLQLADRTMLIPFSSYPERSFRDTFTDGASVFLVQDGALGLPLAVDPLIMYWNTTLYTNGGFVQPPAYWDEVPRYVESINRVSGVDIRTTAFALGTYQNIPQAKDLLSTFLLQADVPIVKTSSRGYISTLISSKNQSESAVRFFTEFSNPSKSVYSWNSAMPQARQAFLSGVLATYFGFASEAPIISSSNPNLTFDVSILPQIREGNKAVYGTFWGVSVVDKTVNIDAAFSFLGAITSRTASDAFAEQGSFASARRDLLSDTSGEGIYRPVFNESAVMARGWLDPNPDETAEIFRQVIQSVTAGGVRISEAVLEADRLLKAVIESL